MPLTAVKKNPWSWTSDEFHAWKAERYAFKTKTRKEKITRITKGVTNNIGFDNFFHCFFKAYGRREKLQQQ